jgi:hypothetical protein
VTDAAAVQVLKEKLAERHPLRESAGVGGSGEPGKSA